MLELSALRNTVLAGRRINRTSPTDRGKRELGVLRELPGIWENREGFEGHAWNLIALPFGAPGQLGDFRLLLNQANETLDFDLVDVGVPNRGRNHQDQHLAALRYLQALDQVAALDAASKPDGSITVPATPDTNDTPKGNHLLPAPGVDLNSPVGIHREPGLFLHLANFADPAGTPDGPGPDLARLASIPHGDTVLAMGTNGGALPTPGAPNLSDLALKAAFDPLPIGLGTSDLTNIYFGPYKHFHDNPFENVFDPTDPLKLLDGAIGKVFPGSTIIETTTFSIDSSVRGGIQNIPFILNQANTTRVTATFWVQKVETRRHGTRFVLQYAQRVLLEFLNRTDGHPGLIQWPHISINTMIRKLP